MGAWRLLWTVVCCSAKLVAAMTEGTMYVVHVLYSNTYSVVGFRQHKSRTTSTGHCCTTCVTESDTYCTYDSTVRGFSYLYYTVLYNRYSTVQYTATKYVF